MNLGALVAVAAWVATGPNVAVLGDSYASGTGAGDYGEDGCKRSDHSVAGALADLGVTVTNVACNGAHISHIFSGRTIREFTKSYGSGSEMLADSALMITECSWPLDDARREVSVEGLRAHCRVSLAPQADAITDETTDVVLTVGGNNLGFGRIAAYCMALRGPGCEGEVAAAREQIGPAIADLEDTIDVLQAAHPHLNIHLTTYPALSEDEGLASVGDEWNEAVAGLARDGVNIVSYPSLVGYLHEDFPDFMHPTPSGWEMMSQAVIADLGQFLAEE